MRKIYRLAAVGATVLTLGCATPALAANPIDVPPGIFVVDQVDALTDTEEKKLNARIKELEVDDGHALYVVYIDSFTSPNDPQKWVGEAASKTGLLSTDSMLAIAVKDRKAQFESHSGGKIAKYDADIFSTNIRPALAEGQWGEAGIAAADGISMAKAGAYTKSSKAKANSDNAEPIDLAGAKKFGIGFIVLGGLGFGGYHGTVLVKRRRKAKAEAAQLHAEVTSMAASAQQDIVKSSDLFIGAEERLGFILVEHGDIVAAHARKNLVAAEEAMKSAVQLQKKINEEQFTDKKLLSMWTEAAKHTKLAVQKLETLEAAATEFVENISRAMHDAQTVAQDLASLNGQATSLAALRLRTGERDTPFRRTSMKSAAKTLEILNQAKQLLSAVQNTPKGLECLIGARELLREGNEIYTDAAERMKIHFNTVDELADLEKHIALTARRAENFSTLRHPNVAGIARQCMIAAREVSMEAGDAGDIRPKLARAVEPMIDAVSAAARVEDEIEQARRALPGLLQDAEMKIIKAETYIARNAEARGRQSMLVIAGGLLSAAQESAVGEDMRVAQKLARQAIDAAEKAYSRANKDVRAAVRAREAARSSQYSSSNSFNSINIGGFGGGGAGGSFDGGGGAGGSF